MARSCDDKREKTWRSAGCAARTTNQFSDIPSTSCAVLSSLVIRAKRGRIAHTSQASLRSLLNDSAAIFLAFACPSRWFEGFENFQKFQLSRRRFSLRLLQRGSEKLREKLITPEECHLSFSACVSYATVLIHRPTLLAAHLICSLDHSSSFSCAF